jgi:hypothetical protein
MLISIIIISIIITPIIMIRILERRGNHTFPSVLSGSTFKEAANVHWGQLRSAAHIGPGDRVRG